MKVVRLVLQLLGALVVVAALLALGVAGVSLTKSESDQPASRKDVEFVLNWGGIASSQAYEVVYGHKSPESFNGYHLTYHCIQLEAFDVVAAQRKDWRAGPEADETLARIVREAAGIGQSERCFSKGAKPNSSEVEAFIWSAHLQSRDRTEGAQVLLVEPQSRRLLYVSYET